MISQEVQKVLDEARAEKELVVAIDLRQKAMQLQISDLQAQIAALPVGVSLSDEDKAALTEVADDLAGSISTLTADTTANVPTPPSAPPVTPSAPIDQTNPPAPDTSSHAADAAASAAAKPL